MDTTAPCPACKEPNVFPSSVIDGRAFRRCFQCLHSWWTKVETPS